MATKSGGLRRALGVSSTRLSSSKSAERSVESRGGGGRDAEVLDEL
jgi:hypothetical protein